MATEKHRVRLEREAKERREARLQAIEEKLTMLVKTINQLAKELKSAKAK